VAAGAYMHKQEDLFIFINMSGADPGICERGSGPPFHSSPLPVPLSLLPPLILPLEVRLLKPARGPGGAL